MLGSREIVANYFLPPISQALHYRDTSTPQLVVIFKSILQTGLVNLRSGPSTLTPTTQSLPLTSLTSHWGKPAPTQTSQCRRSIDEASSPSSFYFDAMSHTSVGLLRPSSRSLLGPTCGRYASFSSYFHVHLYLTVM